MPEAFHGEAFAEKRRYKRKQMKLALQFQCIDKNKVSQPKRDLAEDLGAGGLAMISQTNLAKNQLLMMTIFLPDQEEDGSSEKNNWTTITVLSRVAWSRAQADGAYMIGVEFLDLEPGERQILKTFLIDYELDQADSELYT